MNLFSSSHFAKALCILTAIIFFAFSSADAADGKKWDGKKYPFKLLDTSKTNSESNPFIIDTAGKLAYFGDLAKNNVDMFAFGKKNGLKGLEVGFVHNYFKITSDLDMNGSQFEFVSIPDSGAHFDGGGHVIANLHISDRTTPPYINADTGEAEINLALFQGVGVIKNIGIGKGSSVTYYSVEKKLTLKVFAAAVAVEADEIENCFSEAAITVKGRGDSFIGGVAVRCRFNLTNSSNRGPIIFEGDVIDSHEKNMGRAIIPGGLEIAGVCTQPAKRISGCYNTGPITVKASGDYINIGGIAASLGNNECADLHNTGTITLAATGNIKLSYIGGIFGSGLTSPALVGRPITYLDSGKTYNSGNINVTMTTGKTVNVGGISGGIIGRSNFSGNTYAFGGVYGYINTCNTGSISVSSTGKTDISVGGIAGSNSMIFNSYNSGSISGSSGPGGNLYLGGLGGSGVYVQNSYNIGAVSGKGSGTNVVGGIMGLASVRWGESDTTLYTVLNGFWLRQAKAGGINSTIRYGKGSYFYMNKKDQKKTKLGGVIAALDAKDKRNADSDTMTEDSYVGQVFTFDSATAKVMTICDDDAGKRKSLNGTLLEHLNDMVADKSERLYRTWIIDGSNGGYPVLSATAPAFSHTAEVPDFLAATQIAGTYQGVQKQWSDKVFIYADGTFKRSTGPDGGNWTFDGKRLILKWTKWAPETLVQTAPGIFSATAYKFTLTRTP
jgi:hypothetical protein